MQLKMILTLRSKTLLPAHSNGKNAAVSVKYRAHVLSPTALKRKRGNLKV